jgi:hypothetical protein
MTDIKLYTIILEYRGGTYISQVSADSPSAALLKWPSELEDGLLAELGITRNELSNILKSGQAVPINGCVSVWCISGSVKNDLALMNIIATDVLS